jgi:hypothetical protein
MLDGLLLFSVLDVWRVLLPLGLSIICLGTFALQRLVKGTLHDALGRFLCILSYRITIALVCILGIVGLVVPWLLGYTLPESHIANGPWSYEEICGYLVGLVLLGSLYQQVRQGQTPNGWLVISVMIIFMGVAFIWIARWDAMANVGQVSGGWFMGELAQGEWFRLIPKMFHLIFSSMVTGGMVVAGLGLFGTLMPHSKQEATDSGSMKSSPDLIRYGMGWILSGLVPQMLIGPWLFLLLQNRPQTALIEGVSLTSLVFFVSLTAALLALVLLNASFMVPHVRGLVWGGLGNVAITLILMSIIRYETFGATLFAEKIPFAMAELSGWHVLSVFVVIALLVSFLMRWCVWPSALIFHAALPTAHLDKT